MRTLITGNWTRTITYPWPVGREKDFKSLVDACHRSGIRVIPYHGYQISQAAPEYPFVRAEVVLIPVSQNPDKYPGMIPHIHLQIEIHPKNLLTGTGEEFINPEVLM